MEPQEKASGIKLLVLDVDGVMTDGRIVLNDRGEETKAFNVKDGQGLKLLIQAGIEVVIITGRESKVVAHRARELGIREVYQGVADKGPLMGEIVNRKNLTRDEVCCMGDDIPDLDMFRWAGFPVAVKDAAVDVRRAAGHVTENRGGGGAVREMCELILKNQGKWPVIPPGDDRGGSQKIGFTE
jgi:YrbI family 3-deoxy-D-manno-octulosonate 8-phosphate phosphatase